MGPFPDRPPVVLPLTGDDGRAARTGSRPVYWGPAAGSVNTAVYLRDRLVPGDAIAGPAVIESDDTTTVVPPTWDFRVDQFGNGVMNRTDAAASEVEGNGR